MTAAILNLKLVASAGTLSASWSNSGTGANAIIVKHRPTGSGIPWSGAPMLQIPASASTVTLTDMDTSVSHDVQVHPVAYSPTYATAAGTPLAELPLPLPIPPPPEIT